MLAISCSSNPLSQRVPCCQSLPPTRAATKYNGPIDRDQKRGLGKIQSKNEKTTYSQFQSPGGSRIIERRQNDCSDCRRIRSASDATQAVESHRCRRSTKSL